MIICPRFTLLDIATIDAVAIAGACAAWQCDVFPNNGAATKPTTFEVDEVFAVSTLAFALFSGS